MSQGFPRGRSRVPCFALPILLVLAAAPGVRARQAGSRSADDLIKEALAAFQSGQLETAIKSLRDAHKIAPDNSYASLFLGLFLNQKDPESLESLTLMESVLDRFPTNHDLLLHLMDSYFQTGRASKVPALLKRMQKPMDENQRFAFTVVYTLIRYGRLESARLELDKISGKIRSKSQENKVTDPNTAAGSVPARDLGETTFIEGLIAASSNQKSDALRLFQSADRQDFPPPDSIQMQMLAEALFSLDEYRLSIQAYKVYLEHFPRDANARMHMAIGYYAAGLFARAEENLRKVLEEAPQTPNVHLYLGMTLMEQKSNDEARQHFLKELKAEPRSYQSMAELAQLDYLNGDDENCRRWLDKAQKLNSGWYETNMVFGLLYNRQGQFDRAIRCLEAVIQEKPNYYKAHFQLSLAYRRGGNEAKAEEHFKIYERLLEEEKSRQLEGVSR